MNHSKKVLLKALQTIREFRNLIRSNDIIDAREIERSLAQLLSDKVCWECGTECGKECKHE